MGRTYTGRAAVEYWRRRTKPPRPVFWLHDAAGEIEAVLWGEDPADWARVQEALRSHPERLRCTAPGPAPRHDTTLRLRLPRSLAGALKSRAASDGVSVSHLVRTALQGIL